MPASRPAAALRRWWLVPLIAVSSLLAAIVVLQHEVAASPGTIPAACSRPAPRTAAGFQRMFDALDGAWAGGDQAASVPLPDARTLWLFGDTVSAHRDSTGGYAAGWTLRHNSFLLQQGGCLRDVETHLPESADAWYWPASGIVDNGRLEIFAMKVVRDRSPLDFRLTGTALADYTLAADGTPTLRGLRDLTSAPRRAGEMTLWGQGALASGGFVYVYGTQGDTAHGAFGRALLVARAPLGAVSDPGAWRYFDGAGFGTDARRAVPVVDAVRGVSTSVSPVLTSTGVAVVAKQDEVYGTEVAAWTAPTPAGPFTATPLFAAPSDPARGVLRYSALAHPEFALADGRLLVSVCRNSTRLSAVGRDALLYRPQFSAVRPPNPSASSPSWPKFRADSEPRRGGGRRALRG